MRHQTGVKGVLSSPSPLPRYITSAASKFQVAYDTRLSDAKFTQGGGVVAFYHSLA